MNVLQFRSPPCAISAIAVTQTPLARLEKLIATEFGIDIAHLRQPGTVPAPVYRARKIIYYLAHVTFGMPLSTLAQHFGRSCEEISEGYEAIEDERDSNAFFDSKINRIESQAAIFLAKGGEICC